MEKKIPLNFSQASTILLVNPWIHDFAAYDMWSKPLGLLMVGSYLRRSGYGVRVIDCLDIHHPGMIALQGGKKPKRRDYGTGKFWKQVIPKPPPLESINRPYSRYGIHPEVFRNDLWMPKPPAAILVTSLMTYWYPGVLEAIKIVKEIYPKVPVILGGIYARLCEEHAKATSGADYVLSSPDPLKLLKLLDSLGIKPGARQPGSTHLQYPAFDLLGKLDYVCIVSSMGCPYSCRYCASSYLFPHFVQKDHGEVYHEIVNWHHKWGVRDIAFYDDALLINARAHFVPLMERVVSSGMKLRFHTPNAIHIKEVTPEIAHLMKEAGFTTIRIGLETADFSWRRNFDNKLSQRDFERGVGYLFEAGFEGTQIGAYILVGLPGQSVESVSNTIDFVTASGVMPYLAEYSPLPHTDLWQEAVNSSEYDIVNEPLYHNNTLLPCWNVSQRARMKELKDKVKEARKLIGRA